MYRYHYFEPHITTWKEILNKFKGKKNLKALEIGCFEGRATVWLLKNILTGENAHIEVVDTFEGSVENRIQKDNINDLLKNFRNNIKDYRNKVKIHQNYSYKTLRSLKPIETYDIIYIDGSHMAKDVLEDAILAWRLLKKNGILIFDDYEWKFFKNKELCPKIAIQSFLEVYKNQYKVIKKGYQVYLEKIGDNIIQKPVKYTDNKIAKNSPLSRIDLELQIKRLESDLNKIQNSKTYLLWQKFNFYKSLLKHKHIE